MKTRMLTTLCTMMYAVLAPAQAVAGQTATVDIPITANIVRSASLGYSEDAVFAAGAAERDSKRVVSLSTSGGGRAARMKSLSSNDLVYDITVSVAAVATSDPSRQAQVVESDFSVNPGGLTEKGERELEFGGSLKMKNLGYNGVHSGSVYITTNYN